MNPEVSPSIPGDCTLINANVLHSTKCTNPNKAIVLQIPLDFMEKYIPNVQQLLFILDHTSTDPVRSTKTAMLCTVLEQMQIIDEIGRMVLSCVSTV